MSTLKEWIIRKTRTATGTREIVEMLKVQTVLQQKMIARLAMADEVAIAPSPATVATDTTDAPENTSAVAGHYEQLCRRIVESKEHSSTLGFCPPQAPILISVNGDLIWLPMDQLKYIWHTYTPNADSAVPSFLIETPWYTWIRDRLSPGDQVIDCGANIGLFSLMMSQRVGPSGRVDAFEASPSVMVDLRRNLQLNGSSNVTANHAAVSDLRGMARFADVRFEDARREGSHLVSPYCAEWFEAEDITHVDVPTETLDQYILHHDIEPCLIKIDVEGAEFLVLEGARQYLRIYKPLVVVEIHYDASGTIDYERLEDFLAESGYTFQRKDKMYYCEANTTEPHATRVTEQRRQECPQ